MQVRRWHKFLVLGLVVVCLVVAVLLARRARAGSPGSNSASGAQTTNIPHTPPSPRSRRETIATSLSIAGQFIPYQNVELHAKVAGYIRNIYVDIGDHVHQGQVLAVLEIPELVAQVDEAKAAVHHAEEEIQRAQSDVSRAEADNVALHCQRRAAGQHRQGAAGLDRAAGTRRRHRERPRICRRRSTPPSRRWRRRSSSWKSRKANQQHYSALSDYARITAPYDGVVTWRFSDTGALVQAGTSNTSGLPVVTVAQVNVLRLRIPVPESLAVEGPDWRFRRRARAGDRRTLHRQGRALYRRARYVDPHHAGGDRRSQSRPTICSRACTRMCTLSANSRPNALTVPIEAIQRGENKTSVLVVDPQNRVQSRDVQVGVQSSNNVEILARPHRRRARDRRQPRQLSAG